MNRSTSLHYECVGISIIDVKRVVHEKSAGLFEKLRQKNSCRPFRQKPQSGRCDAGSWWLVFETRDGSITAAPGAAAQALAGIADSTRHHLVIRNDRQRFHDVPMDLGPASKGTP